MNARDLPTIALVVAVIGVTACGDSTPSHPRPAQPLPVTAPAVQSAAVEAPQPPPARALMAEHFTKATEARSAFIAGDMEAAGAAMSWLATNEIGQDSLAPELRPNLVGVRHEAAAFAAATTFSQAGEAFAAMLVRCGDCHAQAHMVPRFTDVPEPTGDTLQDQMRKHAWAAELLWEGIITRDQSRFDQAAHGLADVVVRAHDLPANANDPVRVQAVADNVRTLAAAGLTATDWPGRAQDYGKFLATCATCHRMMQAGDRVRAGLAQVQQAQPLPPAQP